MSEGRLAGRYQPLEVIGRGGEATVLKAVDTRHERLVALKVRAAPAGGSGDDVLAETRRLLSLPAHPGLAHARDDFFDGDRHVLVLDWVEGVNLARLLADEGTPGLPMSSVLRWVAQAAEALTVLHHHDVIHGDVKPANLILDHSGRIVVVDLGSSSTTVTATARGGTSGFRAPEVAAGAPADGARDVFSLAATTFALLTGTAPTGGPPAWRGIAPDVAARLESALRTGLAVDPSRRPATPGELVERLRAGSADQTPTGVGTVLLTDVVDSTTQWELSPQRVPALLAEMQLAVDRNVEEHGGRRLGATVEGDATISVFANAMNALQAAIALQQALTARSGALRVRVGLATGELIPIDGDVLGPTVSRAARVRGLARAGEILLSATTAEVARLALPPGVELIALGPHALRGLEGSDEVAAVSTRGVSAPPDPARCPYPGLASFTSEDADLFFGREEVVERGMELFGTERFVAVVGASGSGKSSLALAGIAPLLTQVVVLRPGGDPERSLERAGLPGNESAALIVDQLEELVTLCDDAAARVAFVDAVLSHPGGLVVTLRADFYGEFGAFPELASRLASSQVLLGPLTADDLVRAVQEPAQRNGLVVEEGLLEVVGTELGDAPGALPLLGHALREAWLRREGRTITLAGYRASGGVRSAIATTAEQALATLDVHGQAIARRVLLRLVELRPDGDTGDPVRQRVPRADLVADATSAGIVDRLIASRLLSADHDTVELAHEAVFRAWPRLRAWVDEDRQWLRQLQHLATSARSWDDAGRPDSELYRGLRLDAAIEALHDRREELTELEVAFVQAGRTARDVDRDRQQRSARRLRRLLIATAAALVLALVAGAVAVVQRRTADDQRRSADQQRQASEVARIAAQAGDLVDDRLDLASLLAVEAHRHNGGANALDALADVLRAQPAVAGFTSFGAPIDAVDVGADGRRGAALQGDRLIRFSLPDLTTEPAMTIPGAAALAVSPDSAKVAVMTGDGVTIVNATTGTVQTRIGAGDARGREPTGVTWIGPSRLGVRTSVDLDVVDITADATPDAPVSSFTVDAEAAVAGDIEGRRVAISSSPAETVDFAIESAVRIWDATTARVAQTVDIPSGRVAALAFQPGGDLLAVGTEDAGLYVVDTTTGDTVYSHPLPVAAAGRFSPDGTKLAIRDGAGTITVVEPTTGEVLLPAVTQALELRNVFFGADGVLVDAVQSLITISTSGREPLASAPFGEPGDVAGAIRSDGRVAWAYRPQSPLQPDRTAESVAFEPDDGGVIRTVSDWAAFYGPHDRWLYMIQQGGHDRIADAQSGATLSRAERVPDRLMVGASDAGASIYVWASFDGQYLDIRRLPDLTPIETGLDSFDWNMVTYGISNDGRQIAFATIDQDDDPTLRVFDIASGEETTRPIDWTGDRETPRSIAFSADDQTLAVGDRAGRITTVDLTTRAVSTSPFEGMHGPVVAMQFADGDRLLALSQDGTIWMFDSTTGQPLGPPIVWATRVDEYSYLGGYLPSSDLPVHHLLVPGPQGLRLWNVDPATWPAVACDRAGRNLTRDEWARYMPTDEPYRATCRQFPAG